MLLEISLFNKTPGNIKSELAASPHPSLHTWPQECWLVCSTQTLSLHKLKPHYDWMRKKSSGRLIFHCSFAHRASKQILFFSCKQHCFSVIPPCSPHGRFPPSFLKETWFEKGSMLDKMRSEWFQAGGEGVCLGGEQAAPHLDELTCQQNQTSFSGLKLKPIYPCPLWLNETNGREYSQIMLCPLYLIWMDQPQSRREVVCFWANQDTAEVFGQEKRSGVDVIRAEQTHIEQPLTQTCNNTCTH